MFVRDELSEKKKMMIEEKWLEILHFIANKMKATTLYMIRWQHITCKQPDF